jgi:hypothetical protein
VVDAVEPGGIDRPRSPGSGKGEADTPRASPPRAVDATPSKADLQADD